MIIGGCTKDERFVAEVTCLDPLRRSRLEVAKLPLTEHELESDNKKWVEFACVTLKNEVYISGKQEPLEAQGSPGSPWSASWATVQKLLHDNTLALTVLDQGARSLGGLHTMSWHST